MKVRERNYNILPQTELCRDKQIHELPNSFYFHINYEFVYFLCEYYYCLFMKP